VFLFAPREAEVEKDRGEDGGNIDGRAVDVDIGRWGRAVECKERREKEVESVEKAEDCVRWRGMSRSDL